ncbi:MAG: hypothetical protein LUQ38_08230 [Methanotrichaceae archaeon]|nr:hypothetical protein [Methanotrichaceae archaeon]
MLIGGTFGQMIEIPASQDLYVDMQNNQVHNSDELRCQTSSSAGGMTTNDANMKEFRGWPMIQFDISNYNISENDIVILSVKASAIHSTGQSGQIAMLPLESNWNEKSSFVDVFFNLRPFLELADNFDTSKMSLNTEDDSIFAFDVSKKLIDAKSKGQRNISFMLMAVTNNSYEVNFMSRETGMGPYLIILSYPSAIEMKKIKKEAPLNLNINQTIMPATAISQMNKSLKEKPFIKTTSSDHMVEKAQGWNEATRKIPMSYELYLRNLSTSVNTINNSV